MAPSCFEAVRPTTCRVSCPPAYTSIQVLAVHSGIAARACYELGDDRPDGGRVRDGVGGGPPVPALNHGEEAAAGLEHTAGDLARLMAGQPDDDGRHPAHLALRALLRRQRAQVLGRARLRMRHDGVRGNAVALEFA